jgi:hypothetical protein
MSDNNARIKHVAHNEKYPTPEKNGVPGIKARRHTKKERETTTDAVGERESREQYAGASGTRCPDQRYCTTDNDGSDKAR